MKNIQLIYFLRKKTFNAIRLFVWPILIVYPVTTVLMVNLFPILWIEIVAESQSGNNSFLATTNAI